VRAIIAPRRRPAPDEFERTVTANETRRPAGLSDVITGLFVPEQAAVANELAVTQSLALTVAVV